MPGTDSGGRPARTVGLVAVSHSRALADAAVALAGEMLTGTTVPIRVAAGLDEHTFGTDAEQIRVAITEADAAGGGAGVVVLMDLGSAVLSAELAVELLDDELAERVSLCPAPLVEGLVVASVSAGGGADRAEVAHEALGALAGKLAQLGLAPVSAVSTVADAGAPPARPDPTGADLDRPGAEAVTGEFRVVNPHGLHARPAAAMTTLARGLNARIELRNRTTKSAWVPATSLSRLATLGALRGHRVQVRAGGPAAREAVDRLRELAEGGFGEHPDSPEAQPSNVPPRAPMPPPVTGVGSSAPIGAAPGLAYGPVRSMGRTPFPPPSAAATAEEEPAADPATEWHRLTKALDTTRRGVQQVRARTAREGGQDAAAIFDAHLALLDDTGLLDDARTAIDGGASATSAWAGAVGAAQQALAALEDPYLRARAADISSVGNQVLWALSGTQATASLPDGEGVLVATDLTPAEAAGVDRSRVQAVVLAHGSPTAHSTILLRSLGIPTIVAAGASVLDIPEDTLLAVDGGTGELVIDPTPTVRRRFARRAAELATREHQAYTLAREPAHTRDGVHVAVGANLGSVADATAATTGGADLAGLVRTEFLFLDRAHAPDVDEQETTYRQIAEAMRGRRITLRTLDAGADKPLSYLPVPGEDNPFLGMRGIRLSLARPELIADQLLAIVRVAHDVPVDLMFPMVSTLDELVVARALLAGAIERDGRGDPPGMRVGIMVEVPATALKAAAFAPRVDFFSIGTNDLAQYALAAERGNGAVAGLGDPLDPGVLRLIQAVCAAAGPDTSVGVCGELAADETATAVLLGLGVRELSVTPPAIAGVKQSVRDVSVPDAETLAESALHANGPEAVRELLRGREYARS